jgi:hypothetical protein
MRSNSDIVYIKLESRMSISNLDAALSFATKTGVAQISDFMKRSIREAMDPNFESKIGNIRGGGKSLASTKQEENADAMDL